MKTGHRTIQTVVAALLMSVALTLGAASVAPAAEAGPRPEVRDRAKSKNTTKKKSPAKRKREVKKRPDRKEPARNRDNRRPEAREDRNRRNDSRGEVRKPRVRREDARNSDRRRPEARPRKEVRRRESPPRHDGRVRRVEPRHDGWRHDGRGHRGDRWHRRVERRHDHLYYHPVHWFARYVRMPTHYFVPRHHRPWWTRATRIYVHEDPFYFHVGLGLYLGGIAVEFDLGNAPPRGYIYYDPYCDEVFWTLAEYHMHLRWYDHPPVLTLIEADYCGY